MAQNRYWNEERFARPDKLRRRDQPIGGSPRPGRVALTLALAFSSLLTFTAGASAQTPEPTPAPTVSESSSPTSGSDSTGNDSSTSSSTSTGGTTSTSTSTSTSTDVKSPTSTSTEAYTAGNVTVTGGAGDGDTIVTIYGWADPAASPGTPAAPLNAEAAASSGLVASPTIVCQYKLGFALIYLLVPTTVGECLADESHNAANGDGLQPTANNGLLVWRKADNWTAFTDGYRTWVNGPFAIQERLNTQRYSWEANPENFPEV